MKTYEIRTKDLKSIKHTYDDWVSPHMAKEDYAVYHAKHGDVLVLHEWEADAEADKMRLDWMEANGHAVTSIEHGSGLSFYVAAIGKFNSVREVIDAARNAPKPTVKVIATPEGVGK